MVGDILKQNSLIETTFECYVVGRRSEGMSYLEYTMEERQEAYRSQSKGLGNDRSSSVCWMLVYKLVYKHKK